ncbi:hypothetical protein BDF14DRAFT_1683074, partial [Spinellus fusiger]
NTPCEQCNQQPWKYKCPSCFLKTCSLPCVKQHRIDKECSGERSKTHYVSLKTYNESTMMSGKYY